MKITLTYEKEQVDYLMALMAKRPIEECLELFALTRNQAAEQLQQSLDPEPEPPNTD